MTALAASPTAAASDYLKALHALTLSARGAPVTSGALAERLGVAAPSASAMLRKLDADGLVVLVPYRGAQLTDAGTRAALHIVRTHRLLERLLIELGLSWDEVHAEADRLEHAVSPRLQDAIDRWLGYPDTDPHGAPIPRPDGTLPQPTGHRPLAALEVGETAVITRVQDASSELLRYLSDLGLTPGTRCTVTARAPFDGPITLAQADRTLNIGVPAAASLYVCTETAATGDPPQ